MTGLLKVSDEMLEDAPEIQRTIGTWLHEFVANSLQHPKGAEMLRYIVEGAATKHADESDASKISRYENALEQIADGRPSYPVVLRIARDARYPADGC